MTDRQRALEECLQIAISKGNTFMAENIKRAMREDDTYNRQTGGSRKH